MSIERDRFAGGGLCRVSGGVRCWLSSVGESRDVVMFLNELLVGILRR